MRDLRPWVDHYRYDLKRIIDRKLEGRGTDEYEIHLYIDAYTHLYRDMLRYGKIVAAYKLAEAHKDIMKGIK
jgi:hypothetical protein